MRIGELAAHMNINPKTIRYYESIKLIPEPDRTASGHRDYDLGAAERLLRSDGFDWGYDVSPDGEQVVIGITAGEQVDRGVVVVQNWFAEFAGR